MSIYAVLVPKCLIFLNDNVDQATEHLKRFLIIATKMLFLRGFIEEFTKYWIWNCKSL